MKLTDNEHDDISIFLIDMINPGTTISSIESEAKALKLKKADIKRMIFGQYDFGSESTCPGEVEVPMISRLENIIDDLQGLLLVLKWVYEEKSEYEISKDANTEEASDENLDSL